MAEAEKRYMGQGGGRGQPRPQMGRAMRGRGGR